MDAEINPRSAAGNNFMKPSKNVKIVVFVPESHTDIVREAIGKSGAGRIGNYTFCSFSSKGVGRFKPGDGAHPAIGEVGKLEFVQEERIEFVCDRSIVENIVIAIKKVHPYEEVAFDIYPLEEL
ncbi:MAG TPA: YqfO family protein [bacterium]|nr:YqfO family protein [bacterium]